MKRILLLCLFFAAFAFVALAQKTVSGTVTDDNGEPLPGVNVVIKGTTTGSTTDLDGNFRLSADEGSTLVFSFVGFETQEIEVGARTVIDISMGGVTELQEVVVTALGVAKEQKALGYAVQKVDGENFTKARETNMVNALTGRIAGVQVTSSSGAVGASSRIVLRGAKSITGTQAPLFVVDGIPIDNTTYGTVSATGTDNTAGSGGGFDTPNGASAINPDDIETISVLKGANAAALYGARAANGVILITTKSGKGTKGLGVSVNSSTTFENPLRLPDFQNSYGQGASETFFEFIDGQNSVDGVDESWGPPLDRGLEFTQFMTNGQEAQPWVSVPNNIEDFYDTGITSSNNVAITAGGDKGNFRLSLTNMDQSGIVPQTDFNRKTIAVSGSQNLTDKFTASFSANYIKSRADNLPTGGYNNENPVQQMIWAGRQVDFEALNDYNNLPIASDATAAAGTPLNWNTLFQNNPYWVQDNNLNQFEKDRLIGHFKLNYQITDWLAAEVKSGTDSWSSVTKERKAKGSNENPEGFYSETYRTWFETNNSFLILINKNINSDLDFSLNLGGNAMHQRYNRIYGEATQLELDGVYNLSNVKSGVTPLLSNQLTERKINSFYGSGSLAFRNYLFLEFTARQDWYSVLPPESNSQLYPSVSLSAVVTDIANINSDILSFLKVRGGWAQVGSDGALTPYSLQPTFQFRTTTFGSTLLPFLPNTLNNPALKPEITNSIEVGVDARFLNGDITLDVTYYDSESKDLLVPVEVSASTGYIFAWDNVGIINNSGIEIQLGAKVLELGDFRWDIDANFAKFNNEVTSLGGLETLDLGGQWNMTLQAREGAPYGVIFGPVFERAPNGQVIHENGLPVIATDFAPVGDIQPDWTGGLNTSFSYKGITLSALIDGKMGGELHSMTYTWGRYAGVLEETMVGRETGIVGYGVIDNGDGTYSPNNVSVTAENYNKGAFVNAVVEGAVFDASYVKLRQVQLSYMLPNSLMGDLPFRDVSLSLVGRNLALLFSRIPHIDPETAFSSRNGEQGQEFGQLPSTRSLGFNINFKL